MAIIGSFTKSDNGSLVGTVRTLTLDAKVRFTPVTGKAKDNTPDFRVLAGPVEIGAAWKKTATGSDREYLSVKLDDPSLAQPTYASLVEAETSGSYNLIWSRRNGT